MFAHQIIDNLNDVITKKVTMKNIPKNIVEKYLSYCVMYRDLLGNSQKFHIDNCHEIRQSKNDNDIFIKMVEYIKLPYEVVYFDFHMVFHSNDFKSKFATLCMMDPNGTGVLIIQPFYYNPERDFWILDFNRFIFDLVNPGRYKIGSFLTMYTEEEKSNLLDTFGYVLKVINNSILLLNCKNIVYVEEPVSESLNKKRLRNNKCPLFTHKTLRLSLLEPKSKILKPAEVQSQNHNRIHLCRGHFKEFTQERPLFGKHVGLYFWDPQVRGQNKDGIVIKDYVINT